MADSQRHPKVTIIAPCKEVNDQVRQLITACFEMDYQDWELIVVDDRVCPGFPSKKRNFALKEARGDTIAFIDSDAHPRADWLTNALKTLNTGYSSTGYQPVAVCGPGILPKDACLREKASDLVLRCLPFAYRVIPRKKRVVNEFPTFNLVVKKEFIPKHGFKHYLTGEDTLFCEDLRKSGEILYNPEIVVYHNRRPLFRPFIKQISTYGLHRGHLISLALIGWLCFWIFYPANLIRGFLKRRL